MTIKPGVPWGEWYSDSGALPVAESDSELAALMLAGLGSRSGPPKLAVTPGPGDVLKTLGLERPRQHPDRHCYPVDLGIADLEIDGGASQRWGFVAHLSIRDARWTGLGPGLSLAVLNAPWMGAMRLGPTAHLNDGFLDLFEGTVGFRQRFMANRRATTGSHLPHPRLSCRRLRSWDRSFSRPTTIWLDGLPAPSVRSVSVEIKPDCAYVVA